MIESEFYSYITDQASITSLVGTRIYPDTAPEKCDYPFLVYSKIDTTRELHLRGATGVCVSRFQLDVFAPSRMICESIIEQVRLRFNGFQGNWGTTFIHQVRMDSESVGWDIESGKDTGIHTASVDLVIVFTESITDFFGG